MSLFDYTTAYAESVLSGDIKANRYVQLACQRHINDLKKEWKYRFDIAEADKFFRFCKYLKHYKGEKVGQCFDLEPWQKFVYGSLYGWVDLEGHWRYKTAYIEIPRKNGKTTMAGAGACYDSAIASKSGAEVYCVATKEDQAKLLYNDCVAYVKQSEELKNIFQVLGGSNIMYVKGTNRTSFVKPLGSDSKRLDGLNPLAVYADELHAWVKRDLWDVFEDAFGARRNYHIIAITTAGHNRTSVCWDERQHLIRILEGQIELDNKFGIIYTLDKECEDDWQNPEMWQIANPNLGVGKEYEYMRDQVTRVKQMPSKLNSFLNKQLNIWTDVAQAWINTDDWNNCANDIDEETLKGKYCYGGMDLARVNDMSACAYFFPKQEGLNKSTLLVDFFIPNHNIREKVETDRVPYDLWAKEHNLILTEGKTTDWDFIKQLVVQRHNQFIVKDFGYDRHLAGELVQSLERENIECTGFGMGYYSMSAPTAELERLIIANEIQHTGCPILAWNISNTIVVQDPAGNMKPDKSKSIEKIDGTVASIIAIGIYLNKKEEKINPYKNRGMRML
mgnify:CR=1 FL=1|tara:strand:- start:2194 stop:3876 length:1683 start_codon:yes stop_codon:yes gene_type:complete